MAGTSRDILIVMTSAASNYNTRLDSSVCIKTRIRTGVTQNNMHYSIQYTTDSASVKFAALLIATTLF